MACKTCGKRRLEKIDKAKALSMSSVSSPKPTQVREVSKKIKTVSYTGGKNAKTASMEKIKSKSPGFRRKR